MALFHLSVTQTKRSAGQSAIASAAYRAGERLYLPVIMRQNGEECANCPYTLDEREHGICRRCAVFKK